jgi:hypothetical protein
MNVLCFVFAVTLLHVGFGVSASYGKVALRGAPHSQIEAQPTNCEFNISILTGAHWAAGDDGLIIMIARLGARDRKRDLNRRRLHNAQTFLTEFGQRAPQTIITAEGERVPSYGRVELYVGGKLFHVLLINPNDDLAVGSCSFEGNDPCTYKREKKLYPCLEKKQRKRR